MRAHSGKVVTAISLAVIGVVLFGLYQTGELQSSLPTAVPEVPAVGANLSEPFKGTPAQDWADGEAGITAPDQNPDFAAAYEQTKKELVAARLDARILTDRDPAALLAPLLPENHGWVRDNLSAVSTRLADGHRLLPVPPKVNGTMRAEKGADGRVVVHTSYRFAYAFHTDNPLSILSQNEIVALVRADVDYTVTEAGLWVSRTEGFVYSMSCEAFKAGLLGPSYADRRFSGGETRSEEDWYASDAPMPTEKACDE